MSAQPTFNGPSAKCLEYVKQHAERGNPTSVINCIDEFASTNHMMNIGQVKGAVIDEEIRKKKPVVMAELGGELYFIDHEKTVYLSDLKLIIGSQTLAPGSFIENNPQFSTERHTISCGRDGLLLPDLSIATSLG
ncbi:uncharacterized protein PITG_16154 [Phytophthora infestans T30-4]|uniref:Uncharacterized protein n=1 Tax=Phytophthora infestans (strain T30-4) TaxID=403677 RepID=D0NT06_PHYIT|nr:uncharacterized protein PITG_16154 [Phytophthora infestans T30-4]EEY64718.1 conserved hypothetical protein [Phytophthora infestans T30-4]|eukprot:XP_002897918.1 conserved hypothetical protein [Phytophthora infestans T30-4]